MANELDNYTKAQLMDLVLKHEYDLKNYHDNAIAQETLIKKLNDDVKKWKKLADSAEPFLRRIQDAKKSIRTIIFILCPPGVDPDGYTTPPKETKLYRALIHINNILEG